MYVFSDGKFGVIKSQVLTYLVVAYGATVFFWGGGSVYMLYVIFLFVLATLQHIEFLGQGSDLSRSCSVH